MTSIDISRHYLGPGPFSIPSRSKSIKFSMKRSFLIKWNAQCTLAPPNHFSDHSHINQGLHPNMPRPRERGRSRTRRGKSRSWSPPNPRFDRDISPDSRDVVHYSRGQRRSTARSPSPLTNAPSVGETAGESETEAGNYTSNDDDSTRHERQRQSKKGKSVRFKNRNHESGHIAGKVSSIA